LLGWLGLAPAALTVSAWQIAKSVLSFLRFHWSRAISPSGSANAPNGRNLYEQTSLLRIGPFTLYGLLFAIVILLDLQVGAVTSRPLDVSDCAIPAGLFRTDVAGSYALAKRSGWATDAPPHWACAAASNNFELAIVTFGVTSD
jgi:ACR3 family arsenite transporter